MCLWQRYPHGFAVLIGITILITRKRGFIGLGAFACFITAGIGVFHSGVEQKWWDGPTSCSNKTNSLSGVSGEDLLSTNIIDKMVMCDEISWAFMSLSMPTWNAIISALLGIIWVTSFICLGSTKKVID